jgi:hypothetical protein
LTDKSLDAPASGNDNDALFHRGVNDDLDAEGYVDLMEFRLFYEGPLKTNGDAKSKHAIRKVFHRQLKRLWEQHDLLKLASERRVDFVEGSVVNILARQFDRCGFKFVPLVNKKFELICSLDILFLRRSKPGEIIDHGGDLDNRMKTLFDALKVPPDCNGISGAPDADESPFFCLLEDDALISALSITTDRLLMPPGEGHQRHNVVLVVHVKMSAAESLLYGNMQFVK